MKSGSRRTLILAAALVMVLGITLLTTPSPPNTSPSQTDPPPSFPVPLPLPSSSPEATPQPTAPTSDSDAVETALLRQAENALPKQWAHRSEARITQRTALRLEIAIFYDDVRIEMSESHFLRNAQGAWEQQPFVRELPVDLPTAFPPYATGRGETEIPRRLSNEGIPGSRAEEVRRTWWRNPQGVAVPCVNYLVRAKKPDGFALEEMWCVDAASGEVARRLSLIDR